MMLVPETRTISTMVVLWGPTAVVAAARRFGATVRSLHAWLRRRRAAAAALAEFKLMSDRELRDIGLSRADMHRVAWAASDPRGNGRDHWRGA
jgi:uncharacterized protein YjiS (DUF1127 family)